ncbi:MAG: undecaprenyl diphosphate synthase family protein [Halobacteriota archaeon]|nr:undecaprenyl diphosphate synthase family protein [Halobacteriota archaeon]
MVVGDAISKIYERRLLDIIKADKVAKNILIVLCEGDLLSDEGLQKLRLFVEWSLSLGVETTTIYVNVIDDAEIAEIICPRLSKRILEVLSNIKAEIFIHSKYGNNCVERRDAMMNIDISIGLGGREELTDAIKTIMEKIESGDVEPKDIDARMIELQLIFKSEPDLIIRSGGRLTDFLIWQSIYSELYFTEVNWLNFRKLDLLRAIRDYQDRKRRFGV